MELFEGIIFSNLKDFFFLTFDSYFLGFWLVFYLQLRCSVHASKHNIMYVFLPSILFSVVIWEFCIVWIRPNLTACIFLIILSYNVFDNSHSVDTEKSFLYFLWIIQRTVASLNAKRGETHVSQAAVNPGFLGSIIKKRIWIKHNNSVRKHCNFFKSTWYIFFLTNEFSLSFLLIASRWWISGKNCISIRSPV